MDSEPDQISLLQSHDSGFPRQKPGIRNRVQHQKCIKILKSALKNITSDTKCMFLMILGTFPLLAFMVIYELNIRKFVDVISELLVQPSQTYYYNVDLDKFIFYDENEHSRKDVRSLLQIVPFYMIYTPLVELFSMTVVTKIAAQTYAAENDMVLCQKNKLKGILVTSLWVQLLSTSNIVGLFWTLANYYVLSSRDIYMNALLVGFHAVFFLAFLYKFLDWSAMWYMGIVVSVLEDEVGIEALEVSGYCRKHSRETRLGFQLMCVFFVYSVVVRLPLLFGGVLVNVIVVVLFCLGNLVKWVALVLYYYECKAQIFLKKVDEEVGKIVEIGEV
ncbi:hypothetical protein RND81_07G192400 [Saponaria officinalis]|uniref:Uncharacterized protein n=1 Tax=Saponaria officinalis TaxID=3572 RepID=A0AAW1JSK7_SAPOF